MRRLKHGKRRKKIFFLRQATKLHAFLTSLVIVFYLAAALLLDPAFLSRDIKGKYAQAANMSFSLRIYGPPGQPEVSGQTGCFSNLPRITLSWDATADTDSYDILRGGESLTTGLQTTSYADTAIEEDASYSYQVIANGLEETASSDAIELTAPDCEEEAPASIEIQAIGGVDLSETSGTPKTQDNTPLFSGTTNIPDAAVEITISGEESFFTSIFANANGYWSWTVPSSLDEGIYTVFATATDPLDSERTATDSSLFKIYTEEDEDSGNEEESETSIPAAVPPATSPPPEKTEEIVPPEKPDKKPPFTLDLKVKNPKQTVYAGKDLEVSIKVDNFFCAEKKIDLFYNIFPVSVSSATPVKKMAVEPGSFLPLVSRVYAQESGEKIINAKVPIPKLQKPGNYKLEVMASCGTESVSTESYFEIQEVPLLALSGGTSLTPTDIMENLSWFILLLLFILIVFLLLLGFEHRLAQNALIQITENFLAKKGFISRRKGVST